MTELLEIFRQKFDAPSGMDLEENDGMIVLKYDDWGKDIENVLVGEGESRLQVRPVGGHERFDVTPEEAARYIEDTLL